MEQTRLSRWTRFKAFCSDFIRVALDVPVTRGAWIYFVFIVVGVAWATIGIAALNNTQATPETIGTFTLGLLVPVFVDAMFAWKNGRNDPVTEAIMALSFLLVIPTSYFSVKKSSEDGEDIWKWGAEWVLIFILAFSILLWGMMYVVEPRLRNPSTQVAPSVSQLGGRLSEFSC
jgi:hypothetical protein